MLAVIIRDYHPYQLPPYQAAFLESGYHCRMSQSHYPFDWSIPLNQRSLFEAKE